MANPGIDIAWARPTVPQIKATGALWVARYFSTDSSKNLLASEVRDYLAADLGIVTVWETTTTRAEAGYAAGVADAQFAEAQRRAVGLPDNHVHHFAVDEDTTWASVVAYFDGAISVLGIDRVGVYGSFQIVEGAFSHGILFCWQTDAWSYGHMSAHATIRQLSTTKLAGGADDDVALASDFGQTPRPLPPTPQDDDMAFEKDIKPGFGTTNTGTIVDGTKCTVIALPPKNGTYWGDVYVSFGSDFGDAVLRVAILSAKNVWRVANVTVKTAGPRVNVAIQDGDAKVSVMRVPATPLDKADSIPVSCLVECFRK